MKMSATKVKQSRKQIGERGVAATAATAPLLPQSPAAAPARQKAGVFAYIALDGTTVIGFSAWRRVTQRANRLRQHGASPAEVVAYLTRKARELDAQLGWLKRLWAARLQRVLQRLALQQRLPMRWDGKDDDLTLPETLCLFAALRISPKECRAPPNDLGTLLKPLSPRWLTPSTPSFCRAPNPCLRVAG